MIYIYINKFDSQINICKTVILYIHIISLLKQNRFKFNNWRQQIVYVQTTLFSTLQWKGGDSCSLARDLIFCQC